MKFITIAVSLVLSLSFTFGEVDHYQLAIEEKGTRFTEKIEIDGENNVEVFRVPAHNDVDGADFYHDFKMRLTVTRILYRKVCYVSEMDSSLPSPRKLKADIQRAATQPGKLPVTTTSHQVMVTGPASRFLLSKEILNFCGSLPIYNTELVDAETSNENGTAIIKGKHLRRRRADPYRFKSFERSCKSMGQKNKNGGKISFELLNKCLKQKKDWGISCKMRSGTCFYFATCEREKPMLNYICKEVHKSSDVPVCCDYICLN